MCIRDSYQPELHPVLRLRFVVFIVSGRLATDYLEELSMESHGDSIEYKGFKIQATPSKRNGKWTWEIVRCV